MSVLITIEATVGLPVGQVWEYWTKPEHITHWNFASDDWHCPSAEGDLVPGGKFSSRMEAKDGSFGFDFGGIYKEVVPNARLTSELGDGRSLEVFFTDMGDATRIVESFEAEGENEAELQRTGWQMILNNFKKYAENTGK